MSDFEALPLRIKNLFEEHGVNTNNPFEDERIVNLDHSQTDEDTRHELLIEKKDSHWAVTHRIKSTNPTVNKISNRTISCGFDINTGAPTLDAVFKSGHVFPIDSQNEALEQVELLAECITETYDDKNLIVGETDFDEGEEFLI